MKHTLLYLILLVAFLSLTDCKKKEEPIPSEDPVANVESDLDLEDGPSVTEEIPNPSVTSPGTFKNIKEVKGNLDNDKDDELVVVYDTGVKGELGTEREIHIFKNKDGNWNLIHKSKGAVLPSLAGGMMLEPFQDISIENKAIVIQHFGGSREKWNYTHRFRLKNNNWVLEKVSTTAGAPCDMFTSYDYTLATGKIKSTISEEPCDGNGEPIDKPIVTNSTFTVKVNKDIFMDGFEPGSNEVVIPNQTEKSFFF